MKKLFPLIIITAIVLLHSGCTLAIPFIVKNASGSSVDVSYKAKKNASEFPGGVLPAIEKNGEWTVLPENRYQFDRESGVVMLKLEPEEEIRVVAGDGFTGAESEAAKFPIEEISFKSANGEKTFRGIEARKQFLAEGGMPFFSDASRYVLTYK